MEKDHMMCGVGPGRAAIKMEGWWTEPRGADTFRIYRWEPAAQSAM